MHPVILLVSAFLTALTVLWGVFMVGRWVGRKKWNKIKRSSMGNTVTVGYGPTGKKE